MVFFGVLGSLLSKNINYLLYFAGSDLVCSFYFWYYHIYPGWKRMVRWVVSLQTVVLVLLMLCTYLDSLDFMLYFQGVF